MDPETYQLGVTGHGASIAFSSSTDFLFGAASLEIGAWGGVAAFAAVPTLVFHLRNVVEYRLPAFQEACGDSDAYGT